MPGRKTPGMILTFLTRPAPCHFRKDRRMSLRSESTGIGHQTIEILPRDILRPAGLVLKMSKPVDTSTVQDRRPRHHDGPDKKHTSKICRPPVHPRVTESP